MAQNFFIKKNSELPILQMKVINDGRNDYKKIFDNLENAAITFSMKEVDCNTCKYKVFNKQALVIPVENEACGVTEYYIGYKFSKNETNMAGTFKAEFKIDFLDDGCSLIVPIYEDLYVTISDSFVNSQIVC
jgi:hypothetical protein